MQREFVTKGRPWPPGVGHAVDGYRLSDFLQARLRRTTREGAKVWFRLQPNGVRIKTMRGIYEWTKSVGARLDFWKAAIHPLWRWLVMVPLAVLGVLQLARDEFYG